MQKIIVAAVLTGLLLGCGHKEDTNRFSITGEIKNLPDQQVFLEQVYFSDKDPEVLDTADVKNGKFEIAAVAPQEGMFRVVFEKNKVLFLVINDQKKINVSSDVNNLSPTNLRINTPANASLYNFITETNIKGGELENLAVQLKAAGNKNDTTVTASDPAKLYGEKEAAFRNYVYAYADTCSSPSLSLFALGYVSNPPGDQLHKAVTALTKRFPNNNDVSAVLNMVNKQREQANQPPPPPAKIPQPGDEAPDISMPDTEGKMFSLSSLRGKYVLVDFWASWCGPCRNENPNVVNAYNKYSSKNFTVLGVSLDKDKKAWLEAIKEDGLTWKHISDLKLWDSEAQKLYQFEGIPYNVLVDPAGKILAVSLRGEDLEGTLAKLIK